MHLKVGLFFIILHVLVAPSWVWAGLMNDLEMDGQACYGREYSEKELGLNPGQVLKHIRVQILKDFESENVSLVVKTTLRQNVKGSPSQSLGLNNFETQMQCRNIQAHRGFMLCTSFCGGKGVVIHWDARNADSNSIIFSNLGFNLESCPENLGGVSYQTASYHPQTGSYFLPRTRGNQEFTLYALPLSFCE